jgi:AraC-like DNA-binding protein
MSPMRYLWLRRMHLARRGLRVANPAATTVTEIATNYGFWELGRFSVAYRLLFGESPSAALRRPAEDPRPQKKSARRGSCLNLHSRRRPAEPTLGSAQSGRRRCLSAAGRIGWACREADAGKRHGHLYRFR